MHAFHFGSSQKRLFGVYHPPETSRAAAAGVVICQPAGHEYIRAHRALRNLAVRLSGAGLHVLRFDYYGTGDSAGEGDETTLAQWKADTGSAMDELKDMSDLSRVSLIGVRLGAAVAAMASAERTDVDALVLWDPVLRGVDYLREILDLQSRWLRTRPWVKVPRAWSESGELIGFPLSGGLRAELENLDLLVVDRWPAKRVTVVTSRGVDAAPLAAHLGRQVSNLAVEQVACDCEWNRAAAVHLMLLANEIGEEISKSFSGGVIA
jgi:pimeloyl-ACP methyl ester carboxylesterase